ncbi:MAG: PH domain-containing protein [Actinomycetota bacterium]|nr:PH domain-containing protein [Rubrobacter sp.]MBA3791389.1 PH domain-containing protein [Rubrobacter sp.]MDQ3236765.1 PH domain-containing protein [Actinomycetota bacterium]MDQ3567988.1 PH domain-containing protein [Actinomycetota bacterium]
MKDEPSERLDPRARTLWRIVGALNALPLLAGGAGGSWAWLKLTDVSFFVWILPAVAAVALLVLMVVVAPTLRWRRWRYEIRTDEVDLQRGIVWVARTLVPLARIQHVDTRSGPLQRRFGLATVVFYTAAGANQIPELSAPVAAGVRDRIAALTKDGLDV